MDVIKTSYTYSIPTEYLTNQIHQVLNTPLFLNPSLIMRSQKLNKWIIFLSIVVCVMHLAEKKIGNV